MCAWSPFGCAACLAVGWIGRERGPCRRQCQLARSSSRFAERGGWVRTPPAERIRASGKIRLVASSGNNCGSRMLRRGNSVRPWEITSGRRYAEELHSAQREPRHPSGGAGALTSHKGQWAYANGTFANPGGTTGDHLQAALGERRCTGSASRICCELMILKCPR